MRGMRAQLHERARELCALLVVAASAQPALAQWTFTLVADAPSNGITPGPYAAISSSEVAFLNDFGTQLYKVGPTGVPVTLFQTGGQIPNTPDSFTYLTYPFSFDGHTFAFSGGVAGGGFAKSGSYAFTTAGTEALAGYGADSPVTGNYGRQAIDGDDGAFGGTPAIRVRRGGVTQVIDSSTALPGGLAGPTNGFGALDFEAGTVVFTAQYSTTSGFKQGIFFDRGDGTGIHKLVTTDDVAPGGSQKFQNLNSNRLIAIDGDDVLFVATLANPGPCPPPLFSCGRSGLFLSRNFGPPDIVAVYDPLAPTTLPGGPERADAILDLALSNGDAAFVAGDSLSGQDSTAIFAVRNGMLERVVGTGDTLGTTLVDAVGGGNEMREGNALAFPVLALNGARSVWRADYGAAPVSASAMIVNGGFGNGLSGWTTSPTGTVGVAAGPAARLTADPSGGPAGPASITQTIDTPNNSFMIFLDHRFTTTTGQLEVLIDGDVVATIDPPATISKTFATTKILVNDTNLMGLTGTDLTLRLNPGSLAEVFLRGIFGPNFSALAGCFGPLGFIDTACHTSEVSTSVGLGLGECADATDHDEGPILYLAQASNGLAVGSDNANASGTALSASFGPLFGGVQWTLAASAASLTAPSCAKTETDVDLTYIITGASGPPVPMDQQLLLTGVIELTGNFAQAGAGTRALVRIPTDVVIQESENELHLGFDITPTGLDTSVQPNNLPPILSANPQSIVETITPLPNGRESRRYDIAIQYTFVSHLLAQVGQYVHLQVGHTTVEVSADPGFAGSVTADFTQTFISTVTTSAPGVQIVAADGDGDGVGYASDNCAGYPNPNQSNIGGIGAASGPDGIGDACQCGDVNGNGRVTTADATLITRSLLVPPTATLTRPDLCSVGGSAACTTADAVIVTRALLVPPTANVQQVCPAGP